VISLRITDLTNAEPLLPTDRRGRRTPQTLLLLDERNALLRVAANRFCAGMSDRQAASHLRTELLRYQTGTWRRERIEATCPPRHAGKLTAALWLLLKTRDHVPSTATIRRSLSFREPEDMLRFHI
jgi:hypothetical protein